MDSQRYISQRSENFLAQSRGSGGGSGGGSGISGGNLSSKSSRTGGGGGETYNYQSIQQR